MDIAISDYLSSLILRIGEAIPVEKIILFGSHAYGSPDEDSDLDLCILLRLNGERKLDLIRKARRAIAPIAVIPVDILLYDIDDFAIKAGLRSTLEYKIKNEEVPIYEQ